MLSRSSGTRRLVFGLAILIWLGSGLSAPEWVRAGGPLPGEDPAGDTVDPFFFGPPFLDLARLDATYTATDLVLRLEFHNDISAPSSFGFFAVYGAIDLDLDQNPGTGFEALQDLLSPPLPASGLGIDFFVDLGSEEFFPGFVDLYDDGSFFPIASVPIVFSSRALAVSIPLATLGDDGIVDATATIGPFFQPTDASDEPVPSYPALEFTRGDCNGSSAIDIADPIAALDFIFGDGAVGCQDACDSNGDGLLNIADPIFELNYIFSDGASPPSPFPGCGVDSTLDVLGCDGSTGCDI